MSTEISLSTLQPSDGSRKRRKRIGFGEGSGKGKTSGKGHKGHKARSGFKQSRGFEGGQMPLHRRLPKFGFTSRKKTLGINVYKLIKTSDLDGFEGNITIETLIAAGRIGRTDKIKLLRSTSDKATPLKKKYIIEVHAASKAAIEEITAAGGQVKIFETQNTATNTVAD
jgi:large subunit ribosomal protein L15